MGLNGTANELGLTGTNLWVYPGPDHDANLRRFLTDPHAELPLVYISFPPAKDPTFEQRFPGRATIDVICMVPYEGFSRWDGSRWKKRGGEHEALKQQFADRLLDVLYQHVPSVQGPVAHAELSTPLSTLHFANYAKGEIYGLAHTPRRFELRCLGPRTPDRHLIFTGQDTAVCGIMGAVVGGILAASTVLKKNLFKVVSR